MCGKFANYVERKHHYGRTDVASEIASHTILGNAVNGTEKKTHMANANVVEES